uniref:Uncharacterized protein n=1 Tax=Picea glauca TaxID=3330 RepID=A0A117NFI4_PICGL|nr:hypothetical protein ABT39_MTgene3515 [Picea glauca]
MAIMASSQGRPRRRLYSRSRPRTMKGEDTILGLRVMSRVRELHDFSSEW